MLNEKCAQLLKQVIQKNYKNISLDKMYADENEFYYEFINASKIKEN